MIKPSKVAYWAKKKEKENFRFRTFLKFNVDPDELDKEFARLHEQYFSTYDCSRCRNCCKMFCASVPAEDLEKDARHLGMSVEEFKDQYFKENDGDSDYITKNYPCDFLQEGGECLLGDEKPISCVEFPHTNKPDRMGSLLSIIDFTGVCPVVYEIYEELKEIYWDRMPW